MTSSIFITAAPADAAFAARLTRFLQRSTFLATAPHTGAAEQTTIINGADAVALAKSNESRNDALATADTLVVVCSQHARDCSQLLADVRVFNASGKQSRTFAIISKRARSAKGEDDLQFVPKLLRASLISQNTRAPCTIPDARFDADGFSNAAGVVAGQISGLDAQTALRATQAHRRRIMLLVGAGMLFLVLAPLALIAVDPDGSVLQNWLFSPNRIER